SQLLAHSPETAADRVSVPRLPASIQKEWSLGVFFHQPCGQLHHLRREDHDPAFPCLALGLVLLQNPDASTKIHVVSRDARNFTGTAACLVQREQEVTEAITRPVVVEDALSFFGSQEPLAGLRWRLFDLLQWVGCNFPIVECPIERPLERDDRAPAAS